LCFKLGIVKVKEKEQRNSVVLLPGPQNPQEFEEGRKEGTEAKGNKRRKFSILFHRPGGTPRRVQAGPGMNMDDSG
jgi:hypothetical protein